MWPVLKSFSEERICYSENDSRSEIKKGVSAILQGTVQGGRRRGRQKKRWESNISEWTGLTFCNALREAENKIKWRERVAMSVAAQQSPWLRDRCKASACVRAKLLLGWLFQFRSFYLTIGKTLDFLKNQANALNRDINYASSFPSCYNEKFSFN